MKISRYNSKMYSDRWNTPLEIFNHYDNIYHFDLDVAADRENTLCNSFYSIDNDGLINEWFGNVWCNPPYSNIYPWVKKASEYNGITVLLLPGRIDSNWFHEFVIPYCKEINFIRGRLKFSESKNNAPFPSIVVIFDNK